MTDAAARALPAPDTLPVLFVCGLHRSGTTALARVLSSAPDVQGMTGTGVPADEGQHLQSVFAPASRYGGPGVFALDPASFLDETSELATPANARTIVREWTPHWHLPGGVRLGWGGNGAAIVLEKSPPNLVRTRFLQRLFPQARFLVVRRHPAVVAISTDRLCPGRTLPDLLQHWVVAHKRYAADATSLRTVHEIRYEDLLEDPRTELRRVSEAVGIDGRVDIRLVEPGLTDPHLRAWEASAPSLPAAEMRRIEAVIARYGYSLWPPYVLPIER